jgi:hypothetical protein
VERVDLNALQMDRTNVSGLGSSRSTWTASFWVGRSAILERDLEPFVYPSMKTWCVVAGLMLATTVISERSLVRAQTPSAPAPQKTVKVEITSDAQTWVSITNLRQPQKFKTLTLQLQPGVYEIVGRRKGYRDESTTLVVKEGMPAQTVAVICKVSM